MRGLVWGILFTFDLGLACIVLNCKASGLLLEHALWKSLLTFSEFGGGCCFR